MLGLGSTLPQEGPPPARQVLLIDGPLAGQTVPGPAYGVIRYEQPSGLPGPLAPPEALPGGGIYYVHKCHIAGRVLFLGSVRLRIDAGDVTAAFWEHLATPLARTLAGVG